MDNQNSVSETPPSQIYTAPHLDNPPPPSPAKHFSISRIILPIMIAILLIAGTSGIFFALNSKPKTQPIVSKTAPTPSPTEASAKAGTPTPIDENSTWKTYINASLGFSFSYPSNLIYNQNRYTEHSTQGVVDFAKFNEVNKPQFFTFTVYKDSPIFGKTASDYLAYLEKRADDKSGAEFTVSSKNKIINSNINGIEVNYGGVGVGKIIAFDKNGILYSFEMSFISFPSIEAAKENEKILDQILSTFKFLDQGGSTACTQEAKLCLDGSYVGREGPSCEFAKCPNE